MIRPVSGVRLLIVAQWRQPNTRYAWWCPGDNTTCDRCKRPTSVLFAVPGDGERLNGFCRACARWAIEGERD